MMTKIFGEVAKHAAHGLVFGKVLKRRDGARFLERGEVSNLLSPRNKGLLLDGVKGRLSERESFQNVCVVARVGAGKTSRYVIPNVMDKAKANCSIVVNDPKGEVFEETSGYMQAHGYEVLLISPEDLTQSSRFNPLAEVRSDIEIEQIAEVLVKAGNGGQNQDPFWNNGAIRLVSILLKLLQRAGYQDPANFTLGNLYYLLSYFGSDGSALDDFVIKWAYDPLNPTDETLWDEWKGATSGNSKTLESFVITALTSLRAFTNQNMVALTAHSSFNLQQLRDKKTIIYFVVPAQHAEYYGFWTSLFFQSVFNASMRSMPTRGQLPIYVLYDEFGHSTLPNFVSVANTIRGYKVSLSIVLQSISQLSARYGRDYAQSIQGGFNTYLSYSGADPETAQFFEQIIGKVIDIQRNKIEAIEERRNEYNLLNADAVRRIESDQVLIVSTNKNPALIQTAPYFQDRRLSRVRSRFGQAHLAKAPDDQPVRVAI